MFILLPMALAAEPGAVGWRSYDAAAFQTAREEGRFVLLDLVAVWCHWCHVMEEKTYTDPAVVELLDRHFVPVQADHDARPDLAERYRDFGWPATVILAPDGTEIVKRAGYIAPEAMARLLKTVVRDSSPESSSGDPAVAYASQPLLSADLRTSLKARHRELHDDERGGLELAQKFLDEGAVRWDMHLAEQGDPAAERRARQTLDAAIALIDPAFGGVYQYSTGFVWSNPHYEKIMLTQARFLRVYAAAYRQFGEARYLAAAEAVAAYLNDFLSAPNGGFYTSQDADLRPGSKAHHYFRLGREERLAQGLPRIDKHQYSGENGMAIEGLVELYRASGQRAYLSRAVRALKWVLAERRTDDGRGEGFRHDAEDVAGPYLGDNLHMGRAFLALYRASEDPVWLRQAGRVADFIDRHFRHPGGGLVSAADNGTPVKPRPQIDQNLTAAEFLIELAGLTGDTGQGRLAAHVMRYLVTPEIALSRATEAGILLLDRDYRERVEISSVATGPAGGKS
jgi:uncharacterized protein YyaL (SSP411 family)